MANTPTTYYSLNKPAIGDSGWGATMNANLDGIDTAIHLVSTALASLTTSVNTNTATLTTKANLSGATFTGIVYQKQGIYERNEWGAVNGSVEINVGTTYHRLTTSGAISFTLVTTGLGPGGYAIGVLIDVTMGGAHTLSWPASVKWVGGVSPSVGSSGRHLICLVTPDYGVNWLGNYSLSHA